MTGISPMCLFITALLLLTSLICSQVIGLPLRSIAPSAIMIIFKREPRSLCWEGQRKAVRSICGLFLKPGDAKWKWWYRTRHLPQTVVCTDAPPIRLLGASLGWTPSQHRRPELSPKPGSCRWRIMSWNSLWNTDIELKSNNFKLVLHILKFDFSHKIGG